ncbi:response regulator [Candidatus Dependentiae bacterium]|nr:response regulator [Candidatus Dependentiae bacterium]
MNKKVLVIDDQQYNHTIIKHTLKDKGFDYLCGLSGREGLTLAVENNPDIILLDIMMPDMDGIEVLKKIKNNPSISNIPVVMLTGKTNKEDVDRAINIGAVKFITKPFNPKELLGEIESVLLGNILMNNKNEPEVIEYLKSVRQNQILLSSDVVKKIIFNFVNSKVVLTEIANIIGTFKLNDLKNIIINLIKNSPYHQVREKCIWCLGQIGNNKINNPDNAIHNNEDIDFLYTIASSKKETTEIRLIACMSIKQLGYAMLIEDLLIELNKKFSENF